MAGQPLAQVVSYNSSVGRPPHQGETLRGTSNHPRQPLLEAATETGEDAKQSMRMPPVHSEKTLTQSMTPCCPAA
eukprot:802407-Amphidinium_carterae.1